MAGGGLLLAAGLDLDTLLKAGTGVAAILATAAAAYAGFTGGKNVRSTRTLEARKQDYVEKTGQIANLIERADSCEARERVLREEVNTLRERDDEREGEVRELRRLVDRLTGDHGWGAEKT